MSDPPPTRPRGIPIPPPSPTDRERMVNRVVVARTDGKRLRGYVYDISTNSEEFHLFPGEDLSEHNAEVVHLSECKAVYFVKSLTGNPQYDENKTDLPKQKRWGRPFEVVFGDGEKMVGTVEIYHPDRRGFYLIPPDPRSNNLRIFVVTANAREVHPLDAATGDGTSGTWAVPDPVRYPGEKRIEVVLRHLRGTSLNDLSMDVYIPVPVLSFWRDSFLKAGREALTDEALALSRQGADPDAPPEKSDRTPPEKRLDVVLRLLAREDQAVVSQVFLVPFKVLIGWHDRFLEAGKAALRGQAADEAGEDQDAVRMRYESLLSPFADREREREELLDELSSVLDDLPGSGPGKGSPRGEG